MSNVLVDGHVHFHECFSLATFLKAAAANFSRHAGASAVGVLLLAQIKPGDPLDQIRRSSNQLEGWSIDNPEATSLIFSRAGSPSIVVIAGRQIETRERIELLSLCSGASLAGKLPLEEAVELTISGGGVPVLPWGFGKWWFSRGQRIRRFCQTKNAATKCLLGDNGCRPPQAFSSILRTAQRHGMAILAGSDPLAITTHVHRPGGYGSVLSQEINLQTPTVSIRDQLINLESTPPTFGSRSNLFHFLTDQLRIRLGKD